MPVDSSTLTPIALSGVVPLKCGYKLNLDSGDHTTAYTKTIRDKCPACSDPSTFFDGVNQAIGHLDSYSSGQACQGKAFHDVPGSPFYTSNVTK